MEILEVHSLSVRMVVMLWYVNSTVISIIEMLEKIGMWKNFKF